MHQHWPNKIKSRGVRFGDFHVIRENSQKAVLMELGYLSNPEEEMTLNSGAFQENAATGIYNGLARYFKEKYKKAWHLNKCAKLFLYFTFNNQCHGTVIY